MSYKKQELIEALIEFKSKHGRYPTRQDFKAKRITPSKNVFYRNFGNMESAIKQAELVERGELIVEDEQEIKSIKPSSKKGTFQCPFCGSYTTDSEKYYSNLTRTLAMRFVDLLNSNNEQKYSDGVMDCIYKVFGGRNLTVRQALRSSGLLEKFEQRYGTEAQALNYKLRCYKCGELKDEWEITVDTSKSYCKDICEDCLSKKQNGKKKNQE